MCKLNKRNFTLQESTEGESLSFVTPFDEPEKWKRQPDDQYDPWTPQERFDMHGRNNTSDEAVHESYYSWGNHIYHGKGRVDMKRGVVPSLVEFEVHGEDEVEVGEEWTVVYMSEDVKEEAVYLAGIYMYPILVHCTS